MRKHINIYDFYKYDMGFEYINEYDNSKLPKPIEGGYCADEEIRIHIIDSISIRNTLIIESMNLLVPYLGSDKTIPFLFEYDRIIIKDSLLGGRIDDGVLIPCISLKDTDGNKQWLLKTMDEDKIYKFLALPNPSSPITYMEILRLHYNQEMLNKFKGEVKWKRI